MTFARRLPMVISALLLRSQVSLRAEMPTYEIKRGFGVHVPMRDGVTLTLNLNTGGDDATSTKMQIADQTIYHDKAHPSYVLIPILPPQQ